jgi:hypothetical protein
VEKYHQFYSIVICSLISLFEFSALQKDFLLCKMGRILFPAPNFNHILMMVSHRAAAYRQPPGFRRML